MGASALISIGTKAMSANYAALQSTSNNIANASTAGYSRQSVDLETATGQYSGAGFFGKGVNVATVQRAHSEFLTREAAVTRSLAAADEARSGQLQQLENIFKTGEAGLGHAAGQVFNAFVDMIAKPQDGSARQVVLSAAGSLAARFQSAGEQIDSLQSGITLDLKTGIAAVNALTRRIADLNQKITSFQGSGHAPNDLLDSRDTAINELSQYVQVTTVAADNGSTSVFLQGGQRLVLGSNVGTLAAVADPYDPLKMQVGMEEGGIARAFPAGFLSGGSLAGLMKAQNIDLVDARNLLGQMASAIAGNLNRQQALGLDLGQPAAAGAPVLSVGVPRTAPASSNATVGGVAVASFINAAGIRVSSVGISVVDSSELLASDYTLETDASSAAGSYRLTRLSDGLMRTVAAGDVIDGFRVDVGTPAPAMGDAFLLQPVGSAARDMKRVLDDPKGLAAASPVSAATGSANQGTASVATLVATSTAFDPDLSATLTFDAAGGYTYSLVDRTGVLPPSSGAGTWTPDRPIELNGWSMQLNGVPDAGDTFSVGATIFPAGDNGNAKALLALRDAPIVGRITLADGTIVPGRAVTDAYAEVIANIGVRVQTAQAAAEQSAGISAAAQTAQSSKSGVNLDEEAARLIQFQQSYQAAAKMLQVAQSVFDTLLQVMSR